MTTTNNKPTLIVIDDEEDMANLVQRTAESLGFQAGAVTNSQQFLNTLSTEEPDIIVLDLIMPDTDGIEILRALAERNSQTGIILMTGYESAYLKIANTFGSAHGLRILGTIAKPFKLEAMEALLSKALPGG